MKKMIIFLTILLLIVGTFLIFSLIKLTENLSFTGKSIEKINSYSFTKAICDDSNFCQDYELYCENRNLISMTPVTGASVQFSKDWIDPRTQETINKLCE